MNTYTASDTLIWVAIITAVPSLLAAISSWMTHKRISSVKVEIDGRFSELLRLTRDAGIAHGMNEERLRVSQIDAAVLAANTAAAAATASAKVLAIAAATAADRVVKTVSQP